MAIEIEDCGDVIFVTEIDLKESDISRTNNSIIIANGNIQGEFRGWLELK